MASLSLARRGGGLLRLRPELLLRSGRLAASWQHQPQPLQQPPAFLGSWTHLGATAGRAGLRTSARSRTPVTPASVAQDPPTPVTPGSLRITLELDDPLCVQKLSSLESPGAREDFARTALKIGISTMHHINFHVDVDRLRLESSRLLELLQQQLDSGARRMSEQMTAQLGEYFHPLSGRFNERVERLLSDDGEIQRVLNQNLGRHEAELARTMAENVGAGSPLMRMLSPNESAGLVAVIRQMVEQQLGQQRQQILMQFSLDHPDSALRRLVQQLNINQTQMQSQVQARIDGLLQEFSLDNRGGALSRLVDNVQAAQRTMSSELSFDNERSAFSRLHRMLRSTHELIDDRLTLDERDSPLALLRRELLGLLEQHAERTRGFQEEVKLSLAELTQERRRLAEARRAAAAVATGSTWDGLEFQAALQTFLARQCARVGDVLTDTGASTGLIRHCKVGDAVIELGPDTTGSVSGGGNGGGRGVRIVVEAKNDRAYSLSRALAEMELARKNRGAALGLFVFSRSTAPPELDGLARFGPDIVVAWDPPAAVGEAEDGLEEAELPMQGGSDAYLRAAVMALRALAISQQLATTAGTPGAGGHQALQVRMLHRTLERSLLEIEKRCSSLDDVTRSAQTIQNASAKILDRIRINKGALQSQLRNLEEVAQEFQALHRAQLVEAGGEDPELELEDLAGGAGGGGGRRPKRLLQLDDLEEDAELLDVVVEESADPPSPGVVAAAPPQPKRRGRKPRVVADDSGDADGSP